jgi:hypothetical protein
MLYFSIHVFLGSKFAPFLIDNISLGVPSCNIRNVTQLSVSHKNWPYARCATAADLACSDLDIFNKKIRSLKTYCLLEAHCI